MHQDKSLIRNWRRMRRLLQACCFALEEEEMEIRPQLFLRSYRLNETAESQHQPPIEKKSTKRDSSSSDNPATNNQMSSQSDVVFFTKPQAAVSQANLDEDNLFMKPMPPI